MTQRNCGRRPKSLYLSIPPLLALIATSCAKEPQDEEPVAQARAALTSVDVMGFESENSWATTTPGAVLARATTHTQGSYSLLLRPSTANGYTPIASTPLSTLSQVSPILAVDVMLPSQQANPWWYGSAQIYLNGPSIGIYSVFLGQTELTGKPLNQWVTLTFPLTNDLVARLLRPGYTDLTITFVLNVAVPTTGSYLVDNLRFLPLAANGCGGRPNGTSCGDDNACTLQESCQNGVCKAAATVTCKASDQCHRVGTCVPSTGVCTNPVKADGSTCNDANACTRTDTCQAGVCNGGNPLLCTAPDLCHLPGTCDPGTGACVGSAPVTCQPPDECHSAGTCDPATGCSIVAKPDGSACSQGGTVCLSGTCSALSGICIVRDNVTNMPNFADPDVGGGYAKLAVASVNDLDGLKLACTDAIYSNLLAQHCAVSDTPVTAQVATFNADGSPNSTTCDGDSCTQLRCPVLGACIVRDNVTDMPNYGDPDVAAGYAKQVVSGASSLDDLKTICTSAIFDSLLAQHCAGSNTVVTAQVVTFNADGSPNSTTCDDDRCTPLACPVLGACIVRDNVTDMPNYGDPDVAVGYAKQAVSGATSLEDLQLMCTSAIYDSLLAQHCVGSNTPVAAQVVTFNADGTPNSTTCDDSGCGTLACY